MARGNPAEIAEKIAEVKLLLTNSDVSKDQACRQAGIKTHNYDYHTKQKFKRGRYATTAAKPQHITMIIPDKKSGSLTRVRALLEMASEELARIENA